MKKLALLALVVLSGCAQFPICTWQPLSQKEFENKCNNWDARVIACQTVEENTCTIYTRKLKLDEADGSYRPTE